MALRLAFLLLWLGLLLGGPALADGPAQARHQNIERIQSALGPGGVARVPISRSEVDLKLSSMSDVELQQLAEGLQQPNHVNDPMAVVLASLVLLVIVVMLVVAIVE